MYESKWQLRNMYERNMYEIRIKVSLSYERDEANYLNKARVAARQQGEVWRSPHFIF
jgi:hypothetical protein